MENSKVEKLEALIFYSLCGFSLFTCVSIAVANIFLGFSILFFVCRLYFKHDDIFSLHIDTRLIKVIGVFLMIALVSGLVSPEPLVGLNRFWGIYVYRMMPLVITLVIIKDKRKILQMAACIWLSLVLDSAFAIWQGLHGNLRANGFIGHPMTLAGFLTMGIPVVSIVAIQLESKCFMKKCLIASLLVFTAALLFNGTRGAWLAVFITLPVATYFCSKNKKRFLASMAVIGVLLILLFTSIPRFNQRMDSLRDANFQSNTERILIWQSAWNIFRDHPVLGVGLGRYTAEYQNHYILPEAKERQIGHAHNNFMQMLGETGFLGFASFTAMILYFFYYGLCGWFRKRSAASLAIFAMTLGLILQGMTEYNFGNSAVMKLYWLLMALCIQMKKFDKGES